MDEQNGEGGAPPPAPNPQSHSRGSASLGKRIDGLLMKLDKRLRKLEVVKEQAAEGTQWKATGATPSPSVQQNRCLFLAMEPLAEVQYALQSAVLGETGTSQSGRRELYQLGHNDCERIARLRALTLSLASAAEGTQMAMHPTLKRCNRVCDAVEAVMQDSGLAARLVEAKKRKQEALDKKRALIASSIEESPKRFRLPHTGGDTMILFRELDDTDHGLESPVIEIVDHIFDCYDKDGNGLVEGDEYYQVIADLAAHVLQEAQARAEKYGSKLFVPQEKFLKDWITRVVDPNLDGAITREEARIGFKKVVDDIDDK